jgi:hypothetical protein
VWRCIELLRLFSCGFQQINCCWSLHHCHVSISYQVLAEWWTRSMFFDDICGISRQERWFPCVHNISGYGLRVSYSSRVFLRRFHRNIGECRSEFFNETIRLVQLLIGWKLQTLQSESANGCPCSLCCRDIITNGCLVRFPRLKLIAGASCDFVPNEVGIFGP